MSKRLKTEIVPASSLATQPGFKIVPATRDGPLGYEARRREAAQKILPFLRMMILRNDGAAVNYDKEKLLLYLDAIRVDFMALVAADPTFDSDARIYVSQLVSGLSKGWPQVVRFFDSPTQADRGVALMISLVIGAAQVMDAFGIRISYRADEDHEEGDHASTITSSNR